ncbi:neuropeptide FF receptor 2-like [Oculina patagonica]
MKVTIGGLILSISFGILVLIDLIGNTLVILVVASKRYMHTSVNYLLVNLALADILIGLAILPQYVLRFAFVHPQGDLGDVLCKFITGGNFIWVGGAASLFTLMAIAFERYFAVLRPYTALGKITARKLKILVIASWAFAALKDGTPFFIMKYDPVIDFCMETWSDITSARAFTAVIFLLDLLIPLSLMGYLYGRIVYCLWFCTPVRELSMLALLRARKRITKMILIVTVLYALFWTPVVVLYFIAYYGIPNIGYGSVAYNTSVVFVCLNSSVNPFVYSFQNERFRRGFRDLFRSREVKLNIIHLDEIGGGLRGREQENRIKGKFADVRRWTAKVEDAKV